MSDFLVKYELIKVLAEGSYGKVILAKCHQINEGELVAIKIFAMNDDNDKENKQYNNQPK